jgi:hypothetical protein
MESLRAVARDFEDADAAISAIFRQPAMYGENNGEFQDREALARLQDSQRDLAGRQRRLEEQRWDLQSLTARATRCLPRHANAGHLLPGRR